MEKEILHWEEKVEQAVTESLIIEVTPETEVNFLVRMIEKALRKHKDSCYVMSLTLFCRKLKIKDSIRRKLFNKLYQRGWEVKRVYLPEFKSHHWIVGFKKEEDF